MEKLVIIAVAIPLLVVVLFFVMGILSQAGEPPGLVDGQLQPCPDRPNCVSSEVATDDSHFIEPLTYSDAAAEQVISRLKDVIHNMGGEIEVEGKGYLAATFTSSIFRFVDDLEIRLDSANNTIHLRSASRVGYSDRGVNRQRVEQLRSIFLSAAG